MTLNSNGGAHRDEAGRWYVWDKATGERLALWPVDARLLVESGSHTLTAPDDDVPENDLRGHVAISGPVNLKKGEPVESPSFHRVENEYAGPVTPEFA